METYLHELIADIKAIRKNLEQLNKPLSYNIDLFQAVQSQQVSSDCAELAFINLGTANVVLNHSVTIPPTAALSFNGNRNEWDRTVYTVTFQGAGTQICIVARKYYI